MFYEDVRKYYESASLNMVKSFPYGDYALMNAEFLNVLTRTKTSFRQVEYFVKRFKNILSDESKQCLEDEFIQFQVDDLTDEILNSTRIDEAWNHVSKLTSSATGKPKYPNLCKVAKTVLVFFHSNAECERVFSIVNKNKTEFRSSLSIKVLSSLITRKLVLSDVSCYQTEHDDDLLKKCKSATSKGLKK
ncbi:Uncharacterised protein at_DN1620 [Pycnogonum litorale]